MDKLITVSSRTFGGKPTPAVNARNLHKFLTIQSNYRDWIRNRISSYGFEKGIDYLCAKNLADSRATDHFITLDMAKELAMVERNEKGRQARRYFIECEKQLKQQLTLPKPKLPNDLQTALDHKIALYTGLAHIAIKDKFTRYAYDAIARQAADPLRLFEQWTENTKPIVLLKQDVHTIGAIAKWASEELLKFKQQIEQL